MCGVLPYADGEVTFRFPLVVAPRYIPGIPLPGRSVGDGTAVDTDAVPDASRISPPVLLPGFPEPRPTEPRSRAARRMAPMLSEVRSSLHAVQEETRDGYRRIRLHPGERLDRDFILRFRLGGRDDPLDPDPAPRRRRPSRDVRADDRPARDGIGSAPRPRDVVFVLDRSGSMEGWKIVAARRAVARMIDTLGDADRFCVLAFDTRWKRRAVLAVGTLARDRSQPLPRRGVPGHGRMPAAGPRWPSRSTGPSSCCTRPGQDDRDRILVLITDGQVGNEDQILETLGTRLAGDPRLHPRASTAP